MALFDRPYADSFVNPWNKIVFDKIYFFLGDRINNFNHDRENFEMKFENFIGLCTYFLPDFPDTYMRECVFNGVPSPQRYLHARARQEEGGILNEGFEKLDEGTENIKMDSSYHVFLDKLLNGIWDKDVWIHYGLIDAYARSEIGPDNFEEESEEVVRLEDYLEHHFSPGLKRIRKYEPNFSLANLRGALMRYARESPKFLQCQALWEN